MNTNNSAAATKLVNQCMPEAATDAAFDAMDAKRSVLGDHVCQKEVISCGAPEPLVGDVASKPVQGKSPAEWAKDYIADGLAVIPIPYREKGPRLKGWPDIRIQAGEVDQYFTSEKMNIGVLLGKPSGGLVDIDLDCPEAVALAAQFLPQTLTFGRFSKPRSHWIYRCHDAITMQFKDPDGTMLVELRSTGAQTVFPGSAHPSGEVIEFNNDTDITVVATEEMVVAVKRLAAIALLARHWPAQGGRQEVALALSGALLRNRWSDGDAAKFIEAVADAAGDEESSKRAACVQNTRQKVEKGDPYTGIPRLRELIDAKVIERAAEWLGFGSEIPQWVEEMNRRYFVVNEMGRALVYERTKDEVLERDVLLRYAFDDLRKLYLNDRVEAGTRRDGTPLMKDKSTAWYEHTHRRQYLGGVVFAPGGTVPPDKYNLWQGFSVVAKAGNWTLLRAHLQDVICSGNPEHFEYLVNWIARMVQRPGEQGEVAVVLRGGRGAGKGTLGNALAKIVGQHSVYLTNSKHLTGNFNAHLRDAVFVFADEAFFAGDRAHESVLKGLITDPFLTVEAKHQNAVTARNMTHILMASNEKWVVPAGEDERRFFVLDVSEKHKQEKEYFDALYSEMNSGGLQAMLYDLLNRDLSEFDVRKVPKTQGLADQKLRSLRGVESWLLDCLREGAIGHGGWAENELVISRRTAYDDYVAASKRSKEYAPSNKGLWSKTIREVLGNCVKDQRPRKRMSRLPGLSDVKPSAGSEAMMCREREFVFTAISECRAAFERYIGAKIDWEEVIADE